MDKKRKYPQIGDELVFSLPFDRESIPMICTGVFASLHSDSVTIYADFEGNEGDVWEFDLSDVKKVNNLPYN